MMKLLVTMKNWDINVLKKSSDVMKNFYLIYGNDLGIINKYVDDIKKKLNIKEEIRYNLDDFTLKDIVDELSMVGMFEKNKLIVCDCLNFQVDDSELLTYLDNYNKDNYLILVINDEKIDTRKKLYKKLSSVGEIVNAGDNKNYIKTYLKKYVQDNNYKIDTGTLDYLISRVGNNIDNAINEMDKIFLYKIDDKIISRNDINDIVENNMDEEIFLLSEAVIVGNTDKSLNLYHKFINNGYDELSIITLLANQFRFLLQVKSLYDKGMDANSIAKTIEAHPFRVQKTIEKVYSYTKEELAGYLEYLFELDSGIKTGKLDKNLGLELFIINKNVASYYNK